MPAKNVILLVGIVISFVLCASCGSFGSELHVYNWTYYIPDEVLKSFEKETGIRLIYDVYTTNEEMYAKLKAGGEGYDVVFPSGDYVSILAGQEMLRPLQHELLPNLTNINPSILARLKHDPKCRYSVPFAVGSSLVAVNTRMHPQYETSWKLFLQPDLMQRTTMLDDMREVIGAALKSIGYSVNSTNDRELEQAKHVVLSWKNNILKFDTETFAKSFASGALYAVHCYPENIVQEYETRRLETDVVFFVPREGGPMYVDSMCILAGTKRSAEAHTFINYLLRPDVYAKIIERLRLPSINMTAQELVSGKPVYLLESLSNSEFIQDVGSAIIKYNRIWQEIKIGK